MTYNSADLDQLKQYFDSIQHPLPNTVELGAGQRIVDVPKFIIAHFETLRTHVGKHTMQAFYDRLLRLKAIMESDSTKKGL